MAAPDAFSNELARWVSKKCTKSIVFVELRPKSPAHVKEYLDMVSPIDEDEDADEKHATRLKDCGDYQCCTGFVINDSAGLKILTCAHVVGPIFSTKFPIDPNTVNNLYNPFILCIHQEDRFQKREARHRIYMRAQVIQVSGLMDLMVLQVSEQELKKCHHPHPALVFAAEFPKRLERVVMLSWPPGAERTEVIGEIAHHSQSFNAISATNPRGYNMRLS